jgi:glycosyltransferase involved in cell wall biosynthesis
MSVPVSVVIPALNAAATIGRAVASALRQTQTPYEVIVIDDGSTDDTAAAARASGATLIATQHGGPAAARNAGVRAATQPWIAFLDADDAWLPAKLERQWSALALDPHARMVATDYREFAGDRVHLASGLAATAPYRTIKKHRLAPGVVAIRRPDLYAGLVRTNLLTPSTLLVARSLVSGHMAFDEGLPLTRDCCAAEDWEWALRATADDDVLVVEHVLLDRYASDGSLSADPVRMRRGNLYIGELVISKPDRYFPGAAVQLAKVRPWQFRDAALAACRRLDPGRARALLADSMREQPTVKNGALLGVVSAVDSPPGRIALRALRALWKARRSVASRGEAPA